MKHLFNKDWQFAEIPIDSKLLYKDDKPVLLSPDKFFNIANEQKYKNIELPHDWMIYHVKDLYKDSVGAYKKTFTLSKEDISNFFHMIHFEGVYMNCALWVNGKKAGNWKYGYSSFEFDITDLLQEGKNQILLIAVYENCNTRWYSGAGIFRDVIYIKNPHTYIPSYGVYIASKPELLEKDLCTKKVQNCFWNTYISVEVVGKEIECAVQIKIYDKNKNILTESKNTVNPVDLDFDEERRLQNLVPSFTGKKIKKAEFTLRIEKPCLWDTEAPFNYTLQADLLDSFGKILDSSTCNCGFKIGVFTSHKGFFLNGRKIKIYGVCQHHDLGSLGSAFNVNALKRQFLKLKEMGVNSIRCSHNPPPEAFMNLCDDFGFLVDDECFDMWEKTKTPFDYGNYFTDWCEKDVCSWVRKDRNHPSLLMWSIGNEIYDTHVGNGYEITKKLMKYVVDNDCLRVAPITIASNYMMTQGAKDCASLIDVVGYNYLERLYNQDHKKYKNWKIYGSETSATVQSRGIYHFPESLKLVTYSDGQCSCLGNCTTTWGAENTQTVIITDRDCTFSAGQYIWTGWDYIGEPTPYHSKNSFFGQIDTAGFPKDTFYLYKAHWAKNKAKAFVHLLPYWDFNEGQLIDVKAYTNGCFIELFFNGKSLGRQKIDLKKGNEAFGRWQVEYHKGELVAISYDENGIELARDVKKSFEDPGKIIIEPEKINTGNLFFLDFMLADVNGNLVENARNYITVRVQGNADLISMDNGDSTDYDEYICENGISHTRRLFSNRLLAIIKSKKEGESFTVSASSQGLETAFIKYDGNSWCTINQVLDVKVENKFVPVRKIEIVSTGGAILNPQNKQIEVSAKVYPLNATNKEIEWKSILKECVTSDNISISEIKGKGSGCETAVISAVSDGECILRCTASNGTKYEEVISDLNIKVENIGCSKLNPYKLIEACRFSNWDKTKKKPVVSLESGISNRGIGPTWISFEKIDFGINGSDTIHIPIFSFDTELDFELYDGDLNCKDVRSLGKFTYKHKSIYNTFSENVFTLNERLFNLHTISIRFPTELVFQGFYFDKSLKAYSKLRALDANEIIGDSFVKTQQSVEAIGNNVNLDFQNMDFGEAKAKKICICGRSNTENNSINLKFFGLNGDVTNCLIEFPFSEDYEEKIFNIPAFTGQGKLSFIFLPGSNFDFKWFKFS